MATTSALNARLGDDDVQKDIKASYLLPDPGGEVARSLITEARRFRLFGVRILLALYDSPYIKDFSETNTPSSLEETNGSQTY